MKENALFTFLFLLFVGSWNPALAQAPSVDIVTLKNGEVLKGKILRYIPGQTLLFQKEDGQQVEMQDEEVAKILQGVEVGEAAPKQPESSKVKKLPKAKTQRIYAYSMLSFAAGRGSDDGLSLGAGFSQVFGYQTNRWLGLGAGFGVDNYSRRGETVYPIFGELRFLLPSKKSEGNFYATAGGGYSLAFARKSLEITGADGGPVAQFAVGYRAATTEGVDIYVDLGAKFQEAYFERTLFNGDVETRNINFRRVVIRVGIGF